MTAVNALTVYVGKSPAGKKARPAENLDLNDNGSLSQQFRQDLLKGRKRFSAKIEILELPPVQLKWLAVGDTAGVVFWQRGDRAGAATILVNGTEFDHEARAIQGALSAYGMDVPPEIWKRVATEPKPLALNVFFDLYHFTDPVIASAAPAFANAFFQMFGNNEISEGGEPG